MNNSYFIITDNDILLNNQSIDYCNGIKIQNKEKTIYYFNIAKMFFLKEFNVNVKEFHIAQANNISNKPIFYENGNFSWERIKDIENNVSDWVVTDFYTIAKSCSANMFLDCANLSRSNSAFRFGLVNTLPNFNIEKIKLIF